VGLLTVAPLASSRRRLTAVREVALLLIAQHFEMAAASRRDDAADEMRAVLRLALAQCPDAGGTPVAGLAGHYRLLRASTNAGLGPRTAARGAGEV
jgi:hypothetical protein